MTGPSEIATAAIPVRWTPTETAMRTLLRVSDKENRTDRRLHKQVRSSLIISGSRCLLSYVVIPALSPLIQPTFGFNPIMTIPLSLVALFFDTRAVRNVQRSDHRWRRAAMALYAFLIAGIACLLVQDVWRLSK